MNPGITFTRTYYNGGASWGDFDGDGHLDLFLPDWGQNSGTPDAFFRNEGNLQFSRVRPLRARSSLATSGAWADFDGDGDLDVVVANQDDAVFIYQNLLRETGVPGFAAVTGGTAEARGLRFAQSGCLVWGDFNNDGLLDLVLSHDNAGFQIYFATPGGEYELRRRFAGIGVRMLALLDADNDGHLDLITDMTSGDGGYRLYLNQGDGTAFTESSLAPARQFSYVQSAPAVGDFNNDGYPDVFLVYPGLPGALFANVGGGQSLAEAEPPGNVVERIRHRRGGAGQGHDSRRGSLADAAGFRRRRSLARAA
ncbi:MAG: VCBS repeat-containing protein [Verrucomicrobia bacterium]|nr:VCBS repeat-containing protein [Verrucomicrobiota bacterium]